MSRDQKPLKFLSVATVLLGGLPFVLYAWQRYAGDLPSAAEWLSRGINHGPWRWELEGFTVAYPLFLLAAITLVLTLGGALRRRSAAFLLKGLLLIGVQAALLFAQLQVLLWTID